MAELWDVYDKDGRLTGRTHVRGAPLAEGDYHLAVTIVIVNSGGEVFCTLRSQQKQQMPGVWENPGGGVLAGETSLAAAVRELQEETGIQARQEELTFLCRRRAEGLGFSKEGFFMDVYGLKRDFPANQAVLQPEEVDQGKWFPGDEWERKARAGEILAGAYSNEFFAAVRALAAAPAGELLDIYDSQGSPTGRVHRRGTDLLPGEFCLATGIIIFNSAREILCTLRSPEKKVLPNTWECPGGSVLAGETSPQGAVRELQEETGVKADPEELRFLCRKRGSLPDGGELLDLYALRWDIPARQVKLQPGETVDARWFSLDEWEAKVRAGKIWAGAKDKAFFSAVRELLSTKGDTKLSPRND